MDCPEEARPRLIVFPEHGKFWLLDSGALAPLEHCDEVGKLIIQFPVPEAYAQVVDGQILRYGEVIGHIEDLK